jgi:hypothetical protein
VHFDVNREQMITFSNGDFLITGRLTATLTTSIGTSLTINASSPARGAFDANGNLTIRVMGPGFGPLPNLGEGLFLGDGIPSLVRQGLGSMSTPQPGAGLASVLSRLPH